MTFAAQLEKYAELTVRVGLNIQPGQTLWINAPIYAPELTRLIMRQAYEAGARQVYVEWRDDESTRIKYTMAPDEAFDEYPMWRARALEEAAEEDGAYLLIESTDPELLKGVDTKRLTAASRAAGTALAKWREYMSSHKMTWCIIAAPSVGWAQKVFPQLNGEEAVAALWQAIFEAVRVNSEQPVEAWREHAARLGSRVDLLNAKQYKRLHYRAPGTELTVELPAGHVWAGGGARNQRGVDYSPNIPTEEVFTSPRREGTSGVVRSTKPLNYQGGLIENFTLRFENGRVVEHEAEQGAELLQTMLDLDEGARFLGEVALVPHHSPISDSGLVFYNTLYDENASNHLAIGRAFPSCIQGGDSMSPEQLREAGLNHSITHVDFMIGSAEMDIDGELANGELEPIFRGGNWAG